MAWQFESSAKSRGWNTASRCSRNDLDAPMLPAPPPARPESGETPARLEVSLIVYDPLIFATCPHSSDAILALASSLKDRKIRVRSVCKSARHASDDPRTDRSEEMGLGGDNRDAAALTRQRKRLLIARWIVLAHGSKGLIFVTDKDGGPEVDARRLLHPGRTHEKRLKPGVLEHHAHGAG